MSFRLKDILHKSLSDSVFNDLFSGRSNYYYFIGRVIQYDPAGTVPTPDETRLVEHDARNRIINIKKINTGDVSLVIPRKNWFSGRVYDQFDLNYSESNPSSTGATSLKTSDFYVVSSSFQVYKCISNNGGAESIDEPSGNSLDVFETPNDGYKWKFMYTIPLSLRSRFLTDDFMPVTKSVLQSFYDDGQINAVTVDSKGSGYRSDPVVNLVANVHFTTANDGTAGVAGSNTPNIKPVINETTGAIEDVIITFAGSNVAGGNIIVNDSDRTGSNLFPSVTFSLGSNAAVQTLTSNSANFIPVISGGEFKDVLVLDPGKGYSNNGNTTISITGDGTGAVLTPFINDAGELENAIISERGSGFTNAVVNVIGSGTGANLSVSFSTGDLSTSQSRVELSAIDGAIHNYKIVDGGTGFTDVSKISISVTGDGTGANITPNVTSQSITGFTVNNVGSGYTFANVIITDSSSTPGSNANIQPIFSPPNGHGFDAPTELFADSLMFFSTISDEKIHDVTVNNDFRQFGILKDIEQFGSKKLFGNTLGTPTFSANITEITSAGGTTLAADDILELNTDSTRKFSVVEVSAAPSANTVLLTSLNNYTFTGSEVLKIPGSTDTYTINAINKTPDINKFSGEILFIDNRTAVTFSDEQLVSFRTILRL